MRFFKSFLKFGIGFTFFTALFAATGLTVWLTGIKMGIFKKVDRVAYGPQEAMHPDEIFDVTFM